MMVVHFSMVNASEGDDDLAGDAICCHLQHRLVLPRNTCGNYTVVWTSLGPLPRWVPGPTTRWAPGTTRLALHGTWWREAQRLQRRSTRLGSCTCPALYRGLLDVLD
jgi:hypothetical protein